MQKRALVIKDTELIVLGEQPKDKFTVTDFRRAVEDNEDPFVKI